MSRYTLTAIVTLAALAGLVAANHEGPVAVGGTGSASTSPGPISALLNTGAGSSAASTFSPPVAFDAPEQAGPLELGLSFDVNAVPIDTAATRYLVVTVRAPDALSEAARGARAPVDLALVMDVSGSMLSAGKLDQAKRAALALTSELGDADRLALVTFDGAASTLVPLGANVAAKARPLIQGLVTGSGTNLGAGLTLGLETLRDPERVRRLLLLTDGQANQGITEPSALTRMARVEGVTVSAIGLGTDYNEGLLASIADAGGGNYDFVDAKTDLVALYASELHHAATQVSQGTALRLTFAPGVHPVRVYAWDASVEGQTVAMSLGSLSSGQTRTVVVQVTTDAGGVGEGAVAATLTGQAGAGSFHETAALTTHRVASAADAAGFADAAAQGKAASAAAAAAVVDATAQYQRGDVEGGKVSLLRAAKELGTRGAALNDPRMAEQAAQLTALGYMDSDMSVKAQSKTARNLGRGEEYAGSTEK